jgi:hypothetical protein
MKSWRGTPCKTHENLLKSKEVLRGTPCKMYVNLLRFDEILRGAPCNMDASFLKSNEFQRGTPCNLDARYFRIFVKSRKSLEISWKPWNLENLKHLLEIFEISWKSSNLENLETVFRDFMKILKSYNYRTSFSRFSIFQQNPKISEISTQVFRDVPDFMKILKTRKLRTSFSRFPRFMRISKNCFHVVRSHKISTQLFEILWFLKYLCVFVRI